MEEAVTQLLLADARVRFLISDRLHWGRLPQGRTDKAFAILQVATGLPDYVNSGPSGLEQTRLQVDGYALTAVGARDIAAAIIGVLEAFKGTVAGVLMQGGFIVRKGDSQPDGAGGSTQLYRRSTDIILWHSR